MSQKLALTAGAVVAIALGLGFALTIGRGDRFDDCRQSVIAGAAGSIGGPFTLVDKTGKTVTDADIVTEPVLLYFGYTYCPDVCPIDTARNAEVVDLLAERGISATPVMVTVDPERDTPEVIGEYAGYVHSKMIGLTGTPEQIASVAKEFRVLYSKNGAGEDYLMSHTVFTYLLLPEVGYVEFYRNDETPEAVADSVACYASRA